MASARGKGWAAFARVPGLFYAVLVLALAACNTPSGGGPGLEPPGGGDSTGFANGAGEMTLPGAGGAGTGGGVPNVPGKDPDMLEQPPSAASDAGTQASDAGVFATDASAPEADAETDGGGSWAPSCDTRKVICQAVAQPCPMGEVRRVEGGCWAECVPIDACACDEPADCANDLIYTCHMFKMRCGPYL